MLLNNPRLVRFLKEKKAELLNSNYTFLNIHDEYCECVKGWLSRNGLHGIGFFFDLKDPLLLEFHGSVSEKSKRRIQITLEQLGVNCQFS